MMKSCRPSLRSTPRPSLLLGAALLLSVACSEAPGVLAPGQALPSAGSDADVTFNPQPDPPKELVSFSIDNPQLIDTPELRPWQGTYDGDGRTAGVLTVEHLLPAVQRGETLHLRQRWSFGDGVLPAAQVDGVLNLSSGRLELSGRNGDGGTVLIQGWLTSSGGGSSLGGYVMFNPQPDPPKEGV